MNSDRLIRSCWNYKTQIRQLETKVRIAEDRLTSTTARYSGEPVSGGDSINSRREAEAKLADLQTQLQQAIAQQQQAADYLRSIIAGIPKFNQQAILELRYCDLKGWKEIATLTGYSEASVYKIHNKALDAFNRQCNLMRIR